MEEVVCLSADQRQVISEDDAWGAALRDGRAPPGERAGSGFGVDAGSFTTIQDAFELFCQGRSPAGPQWQHALRYWEESVKRPDKVLFLKYEEMLLDPERHLRKLAEFMGCGFSDEEEGSGVKRSSNLFGIKNESFLRKGVAGDWSNHMTPEMAERLDKIVEDALQGSGLTFES
ncbi:hypothetical protein HU200_065508 [Digitaria exilis]|uniref:Sulfotransferase n=1 Tax=Digitaria exilis TaxID=1010633 RepID=A0A834ZZX9_9POAL|nr:hypothetical protein HU200_065508 [Digitaria exilis]